MATIKDVAKLAGVSTSTVSHVLNKTRFVSDAMRDKVQAAVDELHYRPSSIARSLKVNHTNTIGMLVTASTNPFYAAVVQGVERRCYEYGYTLFLCNTEGDLRRMEANLKALEEKRVDGLLLMCSETNEEVFNLFSSYRNMPLVITDWGPLSDDMDRIQDNSRLGGLLATRHLIEKGHTEIGCITGPLNKLNASERLNGFRDAMAEADLPVRDEWIIESTFTCEGGVEAMQKYLSMQKRPTALFICNDMMAFGAMSEASGHGIRIPEDLSIVGYDDIHIACYMTPPLTTIDQHADQLGASAVDMLLERLESKRSPGKSIKIEPTLIDRNSVRNLL